jgi:fibronectin type 3 domain-containing protein
MKVFKVCLVVIICFLLSSIVLSGCGSNPVPDPPTGVTATPGNGQVTISWSPVSGAASYNIYWSTYSVVIPPNSGILLSNVTSPYTQSGLFNGTTYYYVVTTVNGNGESAGSAEVSATPSS